MRTKRRILVLLMLFMVGITLPAFAKTPMFAPVTATANRSWRLAEQLTQNYTSGSWELNKLAQNHFNELYPALVDSTVFNYYDAVMGWVPGNTDCYTYQPGSDYITEILTKLNFMGESIPFIRSIYSYNTENHLTDAAVQVLGLEREWIDVKRIHIQYNNGYLERICGWEEGSEGSPPTFTKSEFEFDSVGRISLQAEYVSGDSTNWSPSYQTFFSYHANDTTNGISLVDLISCKFPQFFYYDKPMETGMISEQIRMIWMYQYWQNDCRDAYSYDNANRLIGHLNCGYFMTGDWVNNTSDTYSYDANGNPETELQQTWDEALSEWLNSKSITSIWELITASDDPVIPASGGLSLSVYPNPFKSDATITVKSKSGLPLRLELFNSKGQKVHEEVASGNQTVALNSNAFCSRMQTSGVYFLKLSQGNNMVTSKIIRIR